MTTIAGRVIVITGASSGIGAATAIEAARLGAKVVISARRVDKLEAVAAQCKKAAGATGGEALVVPCDVAKRAEVDALVAATIAKFGRIDVMFANAGYGLVVKIQDMTDAQFDDIVAANIKGSWYAMQAAAAIMAAQSPRTDAVKKANRGHIILTSSGAGRRGLPLYGAYSMTKSAQLSLAEAMRVELRNTGIYVSTVHPLTTATEFFDAASARSRLKSSGVGSAQTAETVARKVLKLIRKPKPELWPKFFSHMSLSLATMMPGITDYAMSKTIAKRKR